MLHELRIENLLLIERAELRLGEGLNAITGETGAGKTVLAHSLDLLMGGRARPQIVRPGAEEAWVEGTFAIPEGLLSEPDLAEIAERLPEGTAEITLGRRVGSSGRTSAFVAGRSASAADLQLLGSRLLAFYGQHEHRKLTLASAQLEVLDGFAGPKHLAVLRELPRSPPGGPGDRGASSPSCATARGLASATSTFCVSSSPRSRRRLPTPTRSASWPPSASASVMRRGFARRRGERSRRSRAPMRTRGAAMLLAAAETALGGAEGVDEELDALTVRARGLAVELGDLAGELRSYLDLIEAEPGRLEVVEERLAALDRLQRKHGGTVEAVLEHAERCRAEIERLANAGELAEELERRLGAAEARRSELAATLGAARRKAAAGLEARVGEELAGLAMEGASLEVAISEHPDAFGASGAELVELRVATNPGMPVSPLRDAASGGELSRVMLALSGLGSGAGAPTLAFDEIDAGIGGNTARAVGERLRELGTERQVICITHLPQVASLASSHFRITKGLADGATLATVEAVEGDELLAEIVRMLGAERGDAAAEGHARELLAA